MSKLTGKRVLKPGGWLQMVECYYMFQSDNGSITDSNALRQWSNNYMTALGGTKDPRAPLRMQQMFSAAGLVEIECKMLPLPLCAWSNNARERRIGNANKENVSQALSSLALLLFTRRLGMSIQDFNSLIARARQEAANPALKPYVPL
ncbi:hypothetical protein MMC20_001913 [Loxospora ochrophaea]|nr:hypothetical protein [Loxospora ochrophaea]